jgi:murein DD-endopeptidase MepM/ murein hydrolase activator NlpD
MKKNNIRRTKNSLSSLFFSKKKNGTKKSLLPFGQIASVWKYFQKKPSIGYVILTISLMMGVFFMEKGSDIFQASILKDSIVFDGTAMPFSQIPDWYAVGGKSTKTFSEYTSSELLSAPRYDISVLQADKKDRTTVNAKITYSIVYMGNYHMDHIENGGSHPGVDIKLPEGTPIYSIANGVVIKAEEKTTGFGKTVVVRHDNVPEYGTLYSGYAHLSNVKVSIGQLVKKGEKIGESGNTGSSTAPHLHFQIDKNSAPWHPWWPFSTEDAKNAGISFWEGVNVGLGQSEALKNTINPMLFVQKNLSYASSSQNSSDPTDSTSPKAQSIDISSSAKEVAQGEEISLSFRILDKNGAILKTENETLSLSSTDHDINIPTIRIQRGIGNVSFPSKNVGRVYFDAQYKDLKERISVKVITTEKESSPTPSSSDEIQDNAFSGFEISGPKDGIVGKVILLDIKAIDSDGKRTKEVPQKGGFPILVERGIVSLDLLTFANFQNGIASLEFTPSKRGKASVSIGNAIWEADIIEANVSQNAAEIAEFRIDGQSYAKGVPNDFYVVSIGTDGKETQKVPFGKVSIDIVNGSAEVQSKTLSAKDFENGRAKITIIPSSDRISIRAREGVIVGEQRFSADNSKIFGDVSLGDTNARAIGYLKEKGVISGYADGTFKPEKTISRAETLKMIFIAFNMKQKTASQELFSDIKIGEWYAPFVISASAIGLIDGYFDGTFRPSQTIVKAEYFKILLKAIEAPVSEGVESAPFADVPADTWEAPYAKYAKNESLLDFEKNFYPNQNITRAEVAESIYRVLKEQE